MFFSCVFEGCQIASENPKIPMVVAMFVGRNYILKETSFAFFQGF
jgi:hypothetical protein